MRKRRICALNAKTRDLFLKRIKMENINQSEKDKEVLKDLIGIINGIRSGFLLDINRKCMRKNEFEREQHGVRLSDVERWIEHNVGVLPDTLPEPSLPRGTLEFALADLNDLEQASQGANPYVLQAVQVYKGVVEGLLQVTDDLLSEHLFDFKKLYDLSWHCVSGEESLKGRAEQELEPDGFAKKGCRKVIYPLVNAAYELQLLADSSEVLGKKSIAVSTGGAAKAFKERTKMCQACPFKIYNRENYQKQVKK